MRLVLRGKYCSEHYKAVRTKQWSEEELTDLEHTPDEGDHENEDEREHEGEEDPGVRPRNILHHLRRLHTDARVCIDLSHWRCFRKNNLNIRSYIYGTDHDCVR